MTWSLFLALFKTIFSKAESSKVIFLIPCLVYLEGSLMATGKTAYSWVDLSWATFEGFLICLISFSYLVLEFPGLS